MVLHDTLGLLKKPANLANYGVLKKGILFMSEKHPECPLYNPYNCKEYNNPTLCAFVRNDKQCLKKKKLKSNQKKPVRQQHSAA